MEVAFGLFGAFDRALILGTVASVSILYLEMHLFAEKLFLVSVMWGNKNKAVAKNFSKYSIFKYLKFGKYLRIDFNSWNVKQKLLA